jgi:hypothetical protein
MFTMRPAAARKHLLGGLLAAEKSGFEVYLVNEIPIGFGDVERVEAGETGGVVDEAIEWAKRLQKRGG